MEFKALRVPTLNEEKAENLEVILDTLYGVQNFTIALDTQELIIIFDEDKLSFRALIQKLTDAGCSLRHIDAALLL